MTRENRHEGTDTILKVLTRLCHPLVFSLCVDRHSPTRYAGRLSAKWYYQWY